MKFANLDILSMVGGVVDTTASTRDKTAVIVVDIQKDFTTAHNGSLAVNGTDETYIQSAAEATVKLKALGLPIYATQDWHPADHVSFAANQEGKKVLETITFEDGRLQILWPNHCVQDSDGATLLLDRELFTGIIQKGADPKYDSYSGFKDDGGAKTTLDETLKANGIENLIIYGIAADYCVKFTVLDGMAAGYNVMVVRDLTPEIAPDSAEAAWIEMEEEGATIWPTLEMDEVEKLLK